MRRFSLSFSALPVAALVMACLALALPAQAQSVPTLSVTGDAVVEKAPDYANLSIGVTTVAETAAVALASNSEGMEAVIARMKAAGIAPSDMQTTGLSVNPNWTGYDGSISGGPQISGYTAINSLSVDVHALDQLGALLDQSVTDGANTLNGVYFGLADPRPALDEARALAVADARAKAEKLAAAAGFTLGDVVSISEGGGYGTQVLSQDAAAKDVPVEQGQVTYAASVTIVFTLVK